MEHQIQEALLRMLHDDLALHPSVQSDQLELSLGLPDCHDEVIRVMRRLENLDVLKLTTDTLLRWSLTDEGRDVLSHGTPEKSVWSLLQDGQQTQSQVEQSLGPQRARVGISNGMRAKLFEVVRKDWIRLAKSDKECDDPSSSSSSASSVPLWLQQALSKGKDGLRLVSDLKAELTPAQITEMEANIKVGRLVQHREVWLSRKQGVILPEQDPVCELLTRVAEASDGNPLTKGETTLLTRRKWIVKATFTRFTAMPGPNFTLNPVKPVPDLTPAMLQDGSWKTTPLKTYTLDKAKGKELKQVGQVHPLMSALDEVQRILMGMGFQEMNTTRWVENCFWNFDVLFVAQDHPARDEHDTFFVSEPSSQCQAEGPPCTLREAVRTIHQRVHATRNWSVAESQRHVLRTHTTPSSIAKLWELAQDYPHQFKPGKYFSIDRVFRNEQMDKTHLCEFHQVEGFIVDRDLTLGHLMYTIHSFFTKLGIDQVRFKPTYNPYTEPSMEVFGYHPLLRKWIELGNSGMFRPEVLKPLGFDDSVSAIAWGLSLERPVMIKYNVPSIHALVGHKVSFKSFRQWPLCRF